MLAKVAIVKIANYDISVCGDVAAYTVYSRIKSALVFAGFLIEKKLVRGSNPHLSFNRPLPTRQTD